MSSRERSCCFYATRVNAYDLSYADLRVRIAIILGTNMTAEFSYQYITFVSYMQIFFLFQNTEGFDFQCIIKKITSA